MLHDNGKIFLKSYTHVCSYIQKYIGKLFSFLRSKATLLFLKDVSSLKNVFLSNFYFSLTGMALGRG